MATETDVFAKRLVGNKKRMSKGKIFGLSVLALAAAGATYFGLTPHGRDAAEIITGGVQTYVAAKQNPDLIFDNVGGDHVNVLLIGRDVNWVAAKVYDPVTKQYRPFRKPDPTAAARSDTMIIVTLDKTKHTIRMISLPRDAKVSIPDNPIQSGVNKLNAAHAYGGPDLLMRTIHDELGITIHRYAVIKFDGFKKLIDQVGGISVWVDGALKKDKNGKLYRGDIDYKDNWGLWSVHLKPGMQRLTGDQAHGYVRFREDREGDPGRIRRQQQVMRALAKEVMRAGPFKIPGLVKEVRRQFETTLADDEIASAAFFANTLGDSAKIQPITLFGVYNMRGSVLLNKDKNKKLLKTIFGSTFNAKNFLANSPSTDDDEIGVANDSNPGAREVLKEAGLIEEANAKPPVELSVPVKSESAGNETSSSETAESETPGDSSKKSTAKESSRDSSTKESATRDETSDERPRRRNRDREESTTRESSSRESSSRESTTRESTTRASDAPKAPHRLSVESDSSSSDEAPVRSEQ